MSTTAVMFIAFFVMIVIGVPIAWSLGLSAVFALLVTNGGVELALVVSRMYNANNSFTLLALPFFILAGNLMCEGGLSKKLIDFCKSFIGWITGGVSMVATAACFFFSALSGSNAATTAAIGGMMIPELEENGYERDLSSAIVAASGTTGQVVPPSSPMVVYCSIAGCSLSGMFIGGIIPGLMMSLSIMIISYFTCKKLGIRGVKFGGWKNVLVSFLKAIPALLMPVIIIGGIYSGAFTPTEAAVVASLYSLLVGMLGYHAFDLRGLFKIFADSAKTSATGLAVITGAALFSWVLTTEHIPELLANMILGWTSNKILIMLLIDVVLLIAGCFITPTSAIVILTPIFLPITNALGIDPVAFGIIMIVNLAIGSITPPVGGNLFIAQSISGVSIESIVHRVLPYLGVLIVVLLIISIFPDFVMLLPNWLGAVK